MTPVLPGGARGTADCNFLVPLRVLIMHEIFSAGARKSLAWLQDRFLVSQRTVQRDLETLRDVFNAPLEHDDTGCYYYSAKYRRPLEVAGDYFISPHAVERFRRRLARRLTYEQALGEIIKGIRDYGGPMKPSASRPGVYTIRVKGPEYRFRAVVDMRRREGPLPVVATILFG